MTARRARSTAAVLPATSGWDVARRAYGLFCVAMTCYLAFVATWVSLHPAV